MFQYKNSFIILLIILSSIPNLKSNDLIPKYKLLAEDKNQNVSIYQKEYFINDSQSLSIYSQLFLIRQFDTILIQNNENIDNKYDSISLKCIQIDGKGSKEVIFTFNSTESNNLGEHGIYNIKRTLTQIWNIDNKVKLIELIHFYNYSNFYLDFTTDSTTSNYSTNCKYSCKISVSKHGRIFINNTIINLSEINNDVLINNLTSVPFFCEDSFPNQKEGIYYFKNSRYNFKLNN